MQRSKVVKNLKQHFYANVPSPRKSYFLRIQQMMTNGCYILDIGCGHNAPTLRDLRTASSTNIGIDLVQTFDAPDGVNVMRANANELPFQDETFDLVISRSVLEHLERPSNVFKEIRRVLRPGGAFVFLTPNRWDYVSIGASMIPNRLHPWIVRTMTGRPEEDTFPTLFRANSVNQISGLADESGLIPETLELLREHPHYLQFSPASYLLGICVEQTLQRAIRYLRPWIFGILRRPAIAT